MGDEYPATLWDGDETALHKHENYHFQNYRKPTQKEHHHIFLLVSIWFLPAMQFQLH